VKAHTSNYQIVGFTASVALVELAGIARAAGVPLLEDLGSGALVDLAEYGLPREPLVRERVAAGADLVTLSGDKLLGGPQAGIVVGRADLVARLAHHPLRRAVRPDKLTMAALAATLRLYREAPDLRGVLPVLRWLTRPIGEMERMGHTLAPALAARLGPAYPAAGVPAEAVARTGSAPGGAAREPRPRRRAPRALARGDRAALPPGASAGARPDSRRALPARSARDLRRRGPAGRPGLPRRAMPLIIGTAGHIDHGK